MARRKQSSLLRLNPCLRRQVLKTNSYRTIDEILKGKLETIVEEPSPRPQASSSVLVKIMVRLKLQKTPNSVSYMRMSKLNRIIPAPISNLGDSYVRLMNELSHKTQLGGLHVVGYAKPMGIM